jgi:hypothetical protein
MANRPIFIPSLKGPVLVSVVPIEFKWYPGMSKSQKQKSIRSLHESAKSSKGIDKVLEISSKSEVELGVRLSAFNLSLESPDGVWTPVEVLFQGSKVFSNGGPFTDIYQQTSREAKKDERLRTSGHLIAFRYDNRDWPLIPQTVFYDWLYLSALTQNPALSAGLLEYNGFSDIEFNPEKSINCQAGAAALYKSLVDRQQLGATLFSPNEFLRVHAAQNRKLSPVQDGLF